MAEFWMFQGVDAKAIRIQRYCPRRMLMNRGKASIKSLPTAVVLAEMLVAMTLKPQQKAEKNIGARPMRADTWSGFQVLTP